MGVLDDAIREHLDLKRSRGADPGEVEKQAAEALGPARREPPAEPAPAEPGEETVADVPEAEPPTQLAEEMEPPPAAAEPPLAEEEVPEPPPAEEEPGAEVTQLHPVADPPPPAEEPPPLDDQMADEAPLDFPEEKPKERRLWFEQSPPRDSDFDE